MATTAKNPVPPERLVPGREACIAFLESAVAEGAEALSLAIIDFDFFEQANEKKGAAWGDAQIAAAGALLAEAFDGAARLFRYGGDAFAVAWPGQEKERAFLELERVREAFPAACGGITVSVGVAACPDDAAKVEDLVHKAHEALYRAKVTGRNKVCLAREEKMVTKTSHYMQGQLMGLRRLAERKGIGEANLLREALNDLLRKYNA